MNVFIIGSALETAKALDKRRLNKQIAECTQMLDALEGKTNAWAHHPCTLQYKGYERWLLAYKSCLLRYKCGEYQRAETSDTWCKLNKPPFHTEEYFNQMKRRLYTKDPIFYAQWMNLGTSEVNWYYVDGEWRYYKNGKRVTESI